MNVLNLTVEILGVDARKESADAEVRPVGVGDEIYAELTKTQGQGVDPLCGEVLVSKAGQDRPVFYVVVADHEGRTSEDTLRQGYRRLFDEAEATGIASLTLPALGPGTQGLSDIGAAKILAQEILRVARHAPQSLKIIKICLLAPDQKTVFERQVLGYLRHILDTLGLGPYATVDIIIERPEGLVLIERSNPPYGWALPGGFVDCGESLEAAAGREAKEETGLDLEDLQQFHVYSDPDRDPRFHTISTVFTAVGIGAPQFGDDARGLRIIPYAQLLSHTYAFDHGRIIADYLRLRH